jgi:hypothetical protein
MHEPFAITGIQLHLDRNLDNLSKLRPALGPRRGQLALDDHVGYLHIFPRLGLALGF